MPEAVINKASTFKDCGISLMNRVRGSDGNNIVQADISSIVLDSYYLNDPDTLIIDSRSLTVSSVVYNTLQTDAVWEEDATGYNTRYDVPAADIATGGVIQRFEFFYTPAVGEPWMVVWDVDVKDRKGG